MFSNLKNKQIVSFLFILTFTLAPQWHLFSQEKITKESAVLLMTWNKNTPESEMKDDIDALKKNGVTIKYSIVKRNDKGEITALKVEYKDSEGNTGSTEYNGKNPISEIAFHKTESSIGFGRPSNEFDSFPNRLAFDDNITRSFGFQNNNQRDNIQEYQYNFNNPNGENGGKSQSKIVIKQPGKQQLIIENGEVTEGGSDYTPEEIEEIKKNNKMEFHDGLGSFNFSNDFNWQGQENMRQQFDRLQQEMDRMRFQLDDNAPKIRIEREEKIQKNDNSNDVEQTKKEMLKAKDEMLKAKSELEKAKKELQKAKSELKTQRI